METAARVPAEASFDKTQNAAINENTNAPITTTTNTIEHGPQTSAPLPTSTTATNTTGTSDASVADAPSYLQQAREALVSLAGTAQNAMGIDTPSSTLQSLANNTKIDASMPTSEVTGATSGEHVGGVGALPGNASEEGVALLPAERTSVPSRELEGTYPGEKVGGVGALPGGPNETGVALLPDERAVETQSNVEGSANAAAHPRSENPDKADLKTAAAHPIETAKQARRGSTSSASSSSDEEVAEGAAGTTGATGKPRKVSLKDKLTGGAKVAMGKMTKNQEAVAEGQAMRGH